MTAVDWTVVVLVEEALAEVDVEKILALHEERPARYRLIVSAEPEGSMLSRVLDHLSLFEMGKALAAVRGESEEHAERDAADDLSVSLQRFSSRGAEADGEVSNGDAMALLVQVVDGIGADEVIVVTRPHTVEDSFHTDWASTARDVLGVPVLHLYSGGDWRISN